MQPEGQKTRQANKVECKLELPRDFSNSLLAPVRVLCVSFLQAANKNSPCCGNCLPQHSEPQSPGRTLVPISPEPFRSCSVTQHWPLTSSFVTVQNVRSAGSSSAGMMDILRMLLVGRDVPSHRAHPWVLLLGIPTLNPKTKLSF